MKTTTENQKAEGDCSPASCSAFESYWDTHGVAIEPPIMREAMKEIAWNAWCACADHAVLIADSWQHETPSVLRMKLLPNAKDQESRL